MLDIHRIHVPLLKASVSLLEPYSIRFVDETVISLSVECLFKTTTSNEFSRKKVRILIKWQQRAKKYLEKNTEMIVNDYAL